MSLNGTGPVCSRAMIFGSLLAGSGANAAPSRRCRDRRGRVRAVRRVPRRGRNRRHPRVRNNRREPAALGAGAAARRGAFHRGRRRQPRVAVHCGAQTTADTAALASHAAERGAAGVAVIAPPFFALDDAALEVHFVVAAAACAPLPFYVYEFEARSGYAVPPAVIERLRERVPNLRGLKVSDKPWEKVEPYLLEGLDVFVGVESLVARGLAAARRAPSRGSPPPIPRSSPPSFASRRPSTRPRPRGCAQRSTPAAPSRLRRRPSSAVAASRSVRTCGRRFGNSPT